MQRSPLASLLVSCTVRTLSDSRWSWSSRAGTKVGRQPLSWTIISSRSPRSKKECKAVKKAKRRIYNSFFSFSAHKKLFHSIALLLGSWISTSRCKEKCKLVHALCGKTLPSEHTHTRIVAQLKALQHSVPTRPYRAATVNNFHARWFGIVLHTLCCRPGTSFQCDE